MIAWWANVQHGDGQGKVEDVTETAPPDESLVVGASASDRSVGELRGGDHLGRYEIVGEIGAGGCGVVFEAYDDALDRSIAVKLVRYSKRGASSGSEQSRILREGRAIAKLSHPNVVSVHDVGTQGDDVFIAMEFVDGEPIRSWMREPRGVDEVLDVFEQAGRGLAAAHARGVVHRDFKPSNALVGVDGVVRVVDFGLARWLSGDTEPAPALGAASVVALDETVTVAGALVGTPAYMAPEQVRGHKVDHRADQYSFCVSLYEALAGHRPYDAYVETAQWHAPRGRPPSIAASRGVPGWLEAIVHRGLSEEPAQRFASMDDLLAAIRRGKGRRRRFVTAALGGVAIAAIGVGFAVVATDRAVDYCEGVDAPMRAVWNDQRRERVRAALLATDLSYAGETWKRVEHAFDDYAAGWNAARADACEATRKHGNQSEEILERRNVCLDRALLDLDALARVLESADADVARQAAEAAGALGDLSWCSDTEALSRTPLPPKQSEARAAIDAVRTEAAALRAEIRAGRYENKAAMARELVTTARSLKHPSGEADAHAVLGWALHRDGKLDDAKKAYRDALLAAEQAGDARQAAWLWGRLAFIAGWDMAHIEQGEEYLAHARAVAQRLAERDPLHATLHKIEGEIRSRNGNYAEALESAEHGVRWATSWGDDRALCFALRQMGIALNELGREREALAVWDRAVPLYEALFGPAHPDTALVFHNQARSYAALHEYERAVDINRRAIEIYTGAFGREHRYVASSLHNLSNALRTLGQHDDAVAAAQEALAIREAVLREGHPMIAFSHRVVGIAQLSAGHPAEGLASIERALEMTIAAQRPNHPHIARTYYWHGEALLASGRHRDAADSFAKARAIHAANDDPSGVSEDMLGEARVALARGDAARAANIARRALELVPASDDDYEARAAAKFTLARAQWALGRDRPAALRLAREARDGLSAAPAPQYTDQPDIDAWLTERE